MNEELRERLYNGKVCIFPGPYNRGGTEVLHDLEQAKQKAEKNAHFLDMEQYVHTYKDGYIILGYASVWDYFGEWNEANILYKVAAPGTSKGKKWPGEK